MSFSSSSSSSSSSSGGGGGQKKSLIKISHNNIKSQSLSPTT
jgi:hypothetical protein